ncbi:hypothetical protein VEGS09_43260 [Escherichia coli]|nr:hypothetical protein FORC82_4696 [Escherichia coli]BBP28179.1 hypothetical protein VEGS07_43170 [Escherichia coli]BBP32625.1 hypothetical protein VEGS09_43260 [Escherichia coli]BDD26549.1 hypothetical protein VEGS18_A42040 [Escherichia coli]BEA99759.1 hypothetical protein VEE11_43110 [Escherichia coli]
MCFERYVPDKIKAVAMPSLGSAGKPKGMPQVSAFPPQMATARALRYRAPHKIEVSAVSLGLTEWDLNGQSLFASPNIQVARLWQHQGDSDTFAHTTE